MQHPDALFAHRRRITPEDTDAASIVYTPRIPHFVVEVVEGWFGDRLRIDVSRDGPQMVFASLSCTFLSPMRSDDALEIRVALRRLGRSSLGFEVMGYREADDRLCWMAETVCVFIDSAFRSRLVPAELRGILQAEAELARRFPFADRSLTG